MKNVKSSNENRSKPAAMPWVLVALVMLALFGPSIVKNIAIGAEIIEVQQAAQPPKLMREYAEVIPWMMVDPGESACVQIVSEYEDLSHTYRPCAENWHEYEPVYSPYFQPKYERASIVQNAE